MVGPFIFADLMGPDEVAAGSGVDIDAHPHIGLSTVTYLFEGRLVHRDSTGAVQTIEPGAVNWMTAGSGVTHTERSHPDDVAIKGSMQGLQTWVALPDYSEEVTASFQSLQASDVPTEQIGGAQIRVAAGSGWGMESPVTVSSPLVLADIRLDGTSTVPVNVDHEELAVLALEGDIAVNDEALGEGELAVLRRDVASSLSGSGKAVVLGGEPVGKRYIWWNFVSSDPERLEQAKDDWLEQRFPLVPGDHEPYVPLPT